MKTLRETSLSSVRNSMFRIFGPERLPPLPSNANPQSIIEWKQDAKVNQCYKDLFLADSDGIYWSTKIARGAFNEISVLNLSNYHIAFTLSVCDIFLNPSSSGIHCYEKQVKRRMEHYLVSERYLLMAIECIHYLTCLYC